MKKIMILGASVYQVPLIRAAAAMGLYTIVVSIPGRYPGFELADKVYLINTVDKEAVLEAAQKEQIDGICTTGTDVAVATIGYVCEKMGLSGIPAGAAALATDKALMKEAFQRGQVSAARFYRASSQEEARKAAEKIGFPVMVKRVDSSGSRGITLVRDAGGVEAAYKNAVERTAKSYVLVEEVLTGREIGVDGVVQGGKLIFLAPHEKFIYRGRQVTIPVGHGFPYHGTQEVLREIAVQMQRAVDALGMDDCCVNADVFVDGEKVSIVEIGGRTGATCIPELISMYYGFDFYEKILRGALGEKLEFPEKPRGVPCMAKLLMSPTDGIITGIDKAGIERIRENGAEVALDYPIGMPVEAMQNGTTRIGHVVTQADYVEELDEVVGEVYGCIEVDGIPLEELWKK